MNEQTTDGWDLPLIDLDLCDGCGECVRRCPTEAVALVNNKAEIIYPEACNYCEICETYCPSEAIGRAFRISFAPKVRQTSEIKYTD